MEVVKKTKYALLVPPQLKDNGEPASLTYVDTVGYTHLRVLFVIGASDIATTAAPTLTDCDTSGGSYVAITGSALAAAIDAGDDNKMFALDVDLEGRKRYVKPTFTCGDGSLGTNVAIVAILSTPSERAPETAAQAGLEELVAV